MTLVARIKVTLSDVEPQVLRRFDVPLKIKLNRLHDVIQAAMGWTDSHLYEFRAGGSGWGVPDRECHELCVSGLAHAGFRYSHALKRSSNIMAK